MPFVNFDKLNNESELMSFFNEYFRDVVPLIGCERLVADFFKMKPQYLVQIKVCLKIILRMFFCAK